MPLDVAEGGVERVGQCVDDVVGEREPPLSA